MEVKIFELNSQIKVAYLQSQSEVIHAGLMVGVGSRDDDKEFAGLSHFIEHMWFKGTCNRSSLQIINDIESLGGDFNAYTSKEETCVHISLLKNSFSVALDVLSDIYFNSIFPADELIKEREVIVDEIESYEDSPSELIFDDFEELLFKGTSLSQSILGTKKSLSKISSTVMTNHYHSTFLKANVVISFVGNVAFDVFENAMHTYFIDNSAKKKSSIVSESNALSDLFSVVKNKKTTQAHC